MTCSELIRMLALNEISDDYEEPAHVHEQLTRLAEQCGMTINPLDVRLALIDLVKLGWAKAYRLSPEDPIKEAQGAPAIEQADDYYYWITDSGREVQGSFNGWPFDEDGTILAGWRPPAE
jgi:hypothetical protein